MLSKVFSAAIVDLPDKTGEEEKERVRSVIRNSDADFPASQNLCSCGYLGDKTYRCIYTSSQISRYKKKLSVLLLDRIDIHFDVLTVKAEKLTEKDANNVENSQAVIKDEIFKKSLLSYY